MVFHLLFSIFAFLTIAAGGHAYLPGEVYWRSVLPNAEMPWSLKGLLRPDPSPYVNKDTLTKMVKLDSDLSKMVKLDSDLSKMVKQDIAALLPLYADLDSNKMTKDDIAEFRPLYADFDSSKMTKNDIAALLPLYADLDSTKMTKNDIAELLPLYADLDSSKMNKNDIAELLPLYADLDSSKMTKNDIAELLPLYADLDSSKMTKNDIAALRPLSSADLDSSKMVKKDNTLIKKVTDGKTRKTTIVFFENDLHRGNQMKLAELVTKAVNRKATFLPRGVADTIPFSSDKFPEILRHFSLEVESGVAKMMNQTIQFCERANIEGEEKSCATSLEFLVDWIISKLGQNVQVLTSEWKKGSKTQAFTIGEGVQDMGERVIMCHKMKYPYAVFMCHSMRRTAVYRVPIFGTDGTKAVALAVCHRDTSVWTPTHLVFKILNVKPGTVPICHFLAREDIVWTRN